MMRKDPLIDERKQELLLTNYYDYGHEGGCYVIDAGDDVYWKYLLMTSKTFVSPSGDSIIIQLT